MRECKRLIKEFDREVKNIEGRNDQETNKTLNAKKQSMVKELNSYVALKSNDGSTKETKSVGSPLLFWFGSCPVHNISGENMQQLDLPPCFKGLDQCHKF